MPSTAIKLNKTAVSVNIKKTYTLKKTLTPSSSTDKVTWSSSNKAIATVSSTGVVKGIKKGTATITAKTTSGKTATCKVTVRNYLDAPTFTIQSSVVEGSHRNVRITWNKVSSATSYIIYRSTNRTGSYSVLGTVSEPIGAAVFYTNDIFTNGKTYYYKMRASKKVDGKTVYSPYSGVHSSRIKDLDSILRFPSAGYARAVVPGLKSTRSSAFKSYYCGQSLKVGILKDKYNSNIQSIRVYNMITDIYNTGNKNVTFWGIKIGDTYFHVKSVLNSKGMFEEGQKYTFHGGNASTFKLTFVSGKLSSYHWMLRYTP